jgi:hypothetical protein
MPSKTDKKNTKRVSTVRILAETTKTLASAVLALSSPKKRPQKREKIPRWLKLAQRVLCTDVTPASSPMSLEELAAAESPEEPTAAQSSQELAAAAESPQVVYSNSTCEEMPRQIVWPEHAILMSVLKVEDQIELWKKRCGACISYGRYTPDLCSSALTSLYQRWDDLQ